MRVGQVELVSGTLVDDLEVVRNNHRVWEDGVRTRRDAQRTRRPQADGVLSSRGVEVEPMLHSLPDAGVAQVSGVTDLPSGTVTGTRHRKRADRSLEPGAIVGVE